MYTKRSSALILLVLALMAAQIVLAKDPPTYDKGLLKSMESSTCGMAEKGGKSVTGEILGTDASHKQTQEVLCQEYVLESDRIVYRIRPNDQKHPVLLPVGEPVEFRIHKDKLYLRDPEGDKKNASMSSCRCSLGRRRRTSLPSSGM